MERKFIYKTIAMAQRVSPIEHLAQISFEPEPEKDSYLKEQNERLQHVLSKSNITERNKLWLQYFKDVRKDMIKVVIAKIDSVMEGIKIIETMNTTIEELEKELNPVEGLQSAT